MVESAFKHFFDNLEPDHFKPIFVRRNLKFFCGFGEVLSLPNNWVLKFEIRKWGPQAYEFSEELIFSIKYFLFRWGLFGCIT
jgi:hypothetical protein